MKNLETILTQEPVYLHNWKKKDDVFADFEGVFNEGAIEKWKSINILFASYGTDNYTGDAFVLFEREGNLFEVNGSHCSCYGLEGQFEPEETTIEALQYRLVNGKMGQDYSNGYSDNEFASELKQFLGLD